ncbi:MAG: PASTA domain-containing protein [Coriobacteriia bacterium]|nr:PASTA domain-containing protein [Coriobacteriia bacterium]
MSDDSNWGKMKMGLDETENETIEVASGGDISEEELRELAQPKLRENKILFALVTALAVVALLCLLGFIYYLTHHVTAPQETTPGVSSTKRIDVVKVTDGVYENGYLEVAGSNGNFADSASSKAGSSASIGSSGTSVESEADVAARLATYSSGSTSSSSGGIVGIDEDIAKASLKKKGYVVSSVYVCDSAALQGTSAKPKSGLVLSDQTYLGRTEGEKFAFPNIATSASYSSAQTVPNLIGKQWRSARSTLNGRGLNIKYLYEQNSPSAYGTVVFQAPAAGTSIPRGCSVILVLAD